MNGLDLEISIENLARKVKKESTLLLRLGDQTIGKTEWAFDDFSFPRDRGEPNPHLWPNVAYAMRYAEIVRDTLSKMDPANAAYYGKNAETYLSKLRSLDKAIFQTVKTIPEQNRKLLTYHNSFAYFAKRYGMTVIGAVQPSDFRTPSAKEMARIIDQIKAEKIPAIFGSEVFPSNIINQIGRETKVRWVETLRDDDLPGRSEEPIHSYIGMMKIDVQTMAKALGGSPAAINSVDPSDVVQCAK
jgi:zinc/manganese transport system substrate-binding protein/manganese/iron transport system substrate-binding protein